MTVKMTTVTKYYTGTSSDSKPTSDTPPGSIFYETDTRQEHIYNGSAWTTKAAEEFDRTIYPVRAQGTTGGVAYSTGVATEAASSDKAIWDFDTSDYFPRLAGSLAWVSYEINLQLKAESTSSDLTWQLQARDKGETTWVDMCAEQTITDVETDYVARTIKGYLDIESTGVSSMPFEMQLILKSNESDTDVVSSWAETTGDLSGAGEIYCLATFSETSNLYAGTGGAGDVLYTTGDDSWTNMGDISGETGATKVYDLVEHGGLLCCATDKEVYYNNGANTTWNICNGEPKGEVYSLATFGDNLYAGKNNGDVYYTTGARNDGAFVETSGTLSGATKVYCMLEYNDKLYAGTTGIVYTTTGAPHDWAVTSGTDMTAGTTIVRALFEFNSKLYAGTEPYGDIFVTTGDGNWAVAGTLTTGTTAVYCFGEIANTLYAGTGATGDVFSFNEADTTWTETDELASATRINALIAYNSKLYAGTYPNGNAFVAEVASGEGTGRIKNDTVIRVVGEVG